jgi:hypothetical protein
VLAVEHEGGRANARQVVANVHPVQAIEQRGRHLAGRGFALKARDRLRHQRIVGTFPHEELSQGTRAEPPVLANQRDEHALELRAGHEQPSRERSVQDELLDQLRTTRCEKAGEHSSLRRPEERQARGALCGDHRLHRGEVLLHREVGSVQVREACPGPVEGD